MAPLCTSEEDARRTFRIAKDLLSLAEQAEANTKTALNALHIQTQRAEETEATIERLTWTIDALIHLGNYYDMMNHEEIIADLKRRWAERGGE